MCVCVCVCGADMEWLIGSGGANEVDIGFCPLLKLSSMGPSEPWEPGTSGTVADREVDLSSLVWEEEISFTAANSLLEKSFYPFKEVSVVIHLFLTRDFEEQTLFISDCLAFNA